MHELELSDVRVLVGVVFLAEVLVCLLDLAVGGILPEAEELVYNVSSVLGRSMKGTFITSPTL
jgi:hypothetical protein